MSQEKIREVLNAVDCIYEPKMLIELIRWQQEQLDMLYGSKFSDRCYYALKSRAETAEQRIAHLENALSGSPDLT